MPCKIIAIPDGNSQVAHQFESSNNAGQVKVRYDQLTATGFTQNVDVLLDPTISTYQVSSAPTTIWPKAAQLDLTDSYDLGFFVNGRFRENDQPGQTHRWRVAGNFSQKDVGNQGRLRCFLTNPTTGFRVSAAWVLLSGQTGDDFTFEFTSIADDASLAQGEGYQLGFTLSYDDPTLTVQVNSIVRISEAMELEYAEL